MGVKNKFLTKMIYLRGSCYLLRTLEGRELSRFSLGDFGKLVRASHADETSHLIGCNQFHCQALDAWNSFAFGSFSFG